MKVDPCVMLSGEPTGRGSHSLSLLPYVVLMFLIGCGPKPGLHGPAFPAISPPPGAPPSLPDLVLPAPSMRVPEGVSVPALRERTVAIAVRHNPAHSGGGAGLMDALMPLLGDVAPKASSMLSALSAADRADLPSRAGSALSYALLARGHRGLVPLYAFDGLHGELQRKGAREGMETVRIWGDLTELTALGGHPDVDTLLLIDFTLSPATSLTTTPEARAQFAQAHARHREALEAALAAWKRDGESYAEAYRDAEAAYRADGGAYVDDKDAPEARGTVAAQVFKKNMAMIDGQIEVMAQTLAEMPESADARIAAAIEAQERMSKGAFGTVVSARVAIIDVRTHQLLFLGHAEVADRSPEAAVERLGAYLGGALG